jgi:hypothetical protein
MTNQNHALISAERRVADFMLDRSEPGAVATGFPFDRTEPSVHDVFRRVPGPSEIASVAY